MQTVAITGATGFVGSALARRLDAGGVAVRSLVRSNAGAMGQVFAGDLEAGGWPDEAFAGADVVVHCAASIGGPLHHQRRINRDGSTLVATAARKAGVARFIHVSSIAVYGYRGNEFPESRPPSPSPQSYSTTKAEAEAAVLGAFADATIIRPGGIFGPGAEFWSAGFARRAQRLLPINIGSGSGTLPVVFVDDVVDMMCVAMEHPGATGQAFNCCLDPAPSWRQYQAAYGALVGRDRWIPLPASLGKGAAALVAMFARSGTNAAVMDELLSFALRDKVFPMDKAREVLGWQPRFTLAEAVAATEPWLREQGVIGD